MDGMTDIHCHILPGVDDGARNMEETVGLLRMEQEQGVSRLIVTPHFRLGYFTTPRVQVREVFDDVRARAAELGLELYLGCEFHRQNEMAGWLRQESAYAMADTCYVLTEFSSRDSAGKIRQTVTELLLGGYRPVIAHAERYAAMRDRRLVHFLIESGAYIQVNAGAVLGYEGLRSRLFCRKLLDDDLVHLIGSDAHDCKVRIPRMQQCAQWLEKRYGPEKAKRLLVDHPARLLNNEYI